MRARLFSWTTPQPAGLTVGAVADARPATASGLTTSNSAVRVLAAVLAFGVVATGAAASQAGGVQSAAAGLETFSGAAQEDAGGIQS
jgi:hypothetical protein